MRVHTTQNPTLLQPRPRSADARVINQGITLEPGDIIATGTPAGVGARRTPLEWVWPGDVIEFEVVGIGKLRQPVVAV
jgi:2-keto-4-pentenoate hydratase/2-oxohepta-3-ene-1,7-dioic acid hydratase in catechol pathway